MSDDLRDVIAKALFDHLHKPAERLRDAVDELPWEQAPESSKAYARSQADAVLAAILAPAVEASAVEIVTNQRFAVHYLNRYKNPPKPCQLGNWDTEDEAYDTMQDLKRQGHEPQLMRQAVTITYSEWEPA